MASSPTSKRVAFAAVLLVIVIVATVAGVYLKSIDFRTTTKCPNTETVTEGFNALADSSRHAKNGWYNAYIKHYYSNGSPSTSHTIMFTPSVSDVACQTMNEDVINALDCETRTIDTISIRDTSPVMSMAWMNQCISFATAKQPLDPQDAHVRILGGMYSFRKSCLQVDYSSMQKEGGDNDKLRVTLPTHTATTRFIMLSRPLFLITNASKLYHIKYDSEQEYSHSSSMPDGGMQGSVDVVLEMVSDERIWSSVGVTRRLQELYDETPEDGEGLMKATLYYMNYEHPVRRGLGNIRFPRTHVLNLVFRLTKETREKNELINLSTPAIEVKKLGGDRWNVDIGGSSVDPSITIPDMPDGYLVVLWCTNTLTVAYLSRDLVRVHRFGSGIPELSIADDEIGSVYSQIEDAEAMPPALAFPCDTFNIPNLYDMYVKLVAFG